MTMIETLNEVVDIAQNAGVAIMEIYQRDFSIDQKEDKSPLTEADMAAHGIIVAGLKRLTPNIPILSEEDTGSFTGPDGQGRYWLVDPLDGTKEFIKKNGEFTVNIALIEDGVSVLGVVVSPALGVSYIASREEGAFKIDESGVRKTIMVSKREVGSPWKVVGSRSHGGGALNDYCDRLGGFELVPMGSSLKICLVAEGAADIYPRLGPTSRWDTAAAQCVVEQAGGRVVTSTGDSLSYVEPGEVLNPFFLVHGLSCPAIPFAQ